MKKFLICSILLFAICSCGDKNVSNEQDALMEASRQELATALAERDQLLGLVRKMAVTMDEIKRLEKSVSLANAPHSEQASMHSRILNDMAAVQKILIQRRHELSELESKLKQSGLFSHELQEVIDILRRQINSQTSEIQLLHSELQIAMNRIDSLNTTVDSLSITLGTVNSQRDSLKLNAVRIENELNRCYYVVADKATLKSHNILVTGFLRKPKLMKTDFDQSLFRQADKRILDTINTNSGKAELLTSHPDGSYAIVDSAGQKQIQITDAAKFWSLTNYLVVQIN